MKKISLSFAILFIVIVATAFSTRSENKPANLYSWGVESIEYPSYGVMRYYLRDLESVEEYGCMTPEYTGQPCKVLVEGSWTSTRMVYISAGYYYLDVDVSEPLQVETVGRFVVFD